MEDWKCTYLVNQIHRTAYKRYESFVIGSLIHDPALEELQPCTQFYVRRCDDAYALIDLYYPQIELAVEIDEPHHSKNMNADREREENIANKLKCAVRRISISEGAISTQIKQLKVFLAERVIEYKNRGKFQEWLAPRTIDIFQAKREFSRTLFIKIRGEIHPQELMARQTGYWKISRDKQMKIKTIVIVHNGVISRIFSDIRWQPWQANPKKVGYEGVESDSDTLVGTIVTDWNWQQTVTYSEDLY